ncbi:NADH-quinone oxidoreductase subunit C [Promicromonospora umidemergens]|uniref:NADH-quinone oxidoreductase subunit C n=1 Tax=Promicromonospora umidemergens TaxID=629679 RepID=A0ABP8X2D8_9MICO|nr:NADH-quinone oxidoreductase subunit C [Promicromonospora umidemergens]MCP2286118.1 NADH-quinone oxidoreductase subunit C [Promicromonospora umidemergens]
MSDVTPGGDQGSALQAPADATTLELVEVKRGMFGADGSGDTSGYGGLVTPVAMPAASSRPYGSWFDQVIDVLTEVLDEAGVPPQEAIEKVVVDLHGADSADAQRAELTIDVAREHVVAVCRALRDDQDLRFELSLGVSGVHYPHDAGRELHAVYHLASITHSRRLRLEVTASDDDPHIPSTTSVYPSNDWHEREAYDFFGIVFDGHPALTRIEMPDDWVGHPQRKDYPLGGIPVEYKGATVPPPDTRRSYS